MEKTKETFEKGLIANREEVQKWRDKFEEVANVFETKGFSVGGFDERTVNTQLLVLFTLLVEKKVFKTEEISKKLDELKATIEFK